MVNELVIDPFGEEIQNIFRRYTIFNFVILPTKKHSFLVRVNNPPRSLKNFISRLSEALGFGLSVEALEIDIIDIIHYVNSIGRDGLWVFKKGDKVKSGVWPFCSSQAASFC